LQSQNNKKSESRRSLGSELIAILIAHYSIYTTRSLGYLISIPASFLDLYHFLGPCTNRTDQPIYLRFSVVSVKRHSDSTLAFWHSWIFNREGTKSGEVQVKNKPIAVALAGPDGNDMG